MSDRRRRELIAAGNGEDLLEATWNGEAKSKSKFKYRPPTPEPKNPVRDRDGGNLNHLRRIAEYSSTYGYECIALLCEQILYELHDAMRTSPRYRTMVEVRQVRTLYGTQYFSSTVCKFI